MWPAWFYLTGIVPLASARMSLEEFNASAKVAREGPFDRNVEKPLVFLRISASRAAAARMCPAWYYLTGMMALAGAQPLLQKFEAREKLLAKALLTEMLKKCWVSYESARARGMKF